MLFGGVTDLGVTTILEGFGPTAGGGDFSTIGLLFERGAVEGRGDDRGTES